MRRLLAAVAALAALFALPAPAAFADPPCPVLAPTGPLPVEFADGSVQFRQTIFGRAGITVASTGSSVPKALRGAGAATAYWEMQLKNLVGTAAAPADPAGLDAVAASEVQKAQASTGCPNPIIALNEMDGGTTAGPLPATEQRYRDAVLALMRGLAADGATPFLLVGRRFTVVGMEDWWRQVAQVGWIVPEAYLSLSSPTDEDVWAAGDPFRVSRAIRVRYREWVGRLTGIGIPPARIGLILGFQTDASGRANLQPTAAWLEVVKLQSQAAMAVARELGLSTVWSWGWGTFATTPYTGADQQYAACTYLWARDNTLCDAPAQGVPGFDPDLTAGAVDLAATTQCRYTGGSFSTAELAALTAAGVTQANALTALLERSLARTRTTIGPTALLRAERSVIAGQFDGSRGSYKQFLQVQGATPAVARDVIRDQLLEAKIARALRIDPIGSDDVKAYIKAHAGASTRSVETVRPVSWLAGQTQGIALAGLAPPAVLAASAGSTVLLHAADGPVRVKILSARVRLPKAAPRQQARFAVRALLVAEARRAALLDWITSSEQTALTTALCRADALPVVGRSRLLVRWAQLRLQP